MPIDEPATKSKVQKNWNHLWILATCLKGRTFRPRTPMAKKRIAMDESKP
jgi:hypothetical protein